MGADLVYEVDDIQKDVLPPRNTRLYSAYFTTDAEMDIAEPVDVETLNVGKRDPYPTCASYRPIKCIDGIIDYYSLQSIRTELTDAWCVKYWE